LNEADAPESRLTVLIVDDVAENIQILDEILRPYFRVLAALNGAEALRLVDAAPPDMILLDIMMPGMDGFEVCRRLKNEPSKAQIPVIFVTARTDTFQEAEGFAAGAVDYITKPVEAVTVLSRVRAQAALYIQQRRVSHELAEREADLQQTSEQLSEERDSSVTAQLRLARTLDLLHSIMESSSNAIFALDSEQKITFANKSAASLFESGHESDLVGRRLADFALASGAWEAEIARICAGDAEFARSETKLRLSSGVDSLIQISVTPLRSLEKLHGAVVTAEDITEKRNFERQLQHGNKMATLGEMALGIAHEINQPLNVIRMSGRLIQESVQAEENDTEFITERTERIESMVLRATKIINHLRSFGRKENQAFTSMNVNQPVQEAVDLLSEKSRLRSIGVQLDLDDDLPPIEGDGASLEQVFLNILMNGIDALSEGGDAAAGTDSERPKAAKLIQILTRYNANTACVEVEILDNGPGIPAELTDRIFEPFFTTKEVGKGTGLGLSISYGIIEAHSGRIRASRRGDEPGSIFLIELPAQARASGPQPIPSIEAPIADGRLLP
jgi:two-component system cell cycle sensor histidine kinase/response regulator CckA